MGTSMEDVNCEIKKLVARYAPSSSHFYLLVDALWEQVISFFFFFINFNLYLFPVFRNDWQKKKILTAQFITLQDTWNEKGQSIF